MEPHPARLHLEQIAASLTTVELHWTEINDELDRRGIGRKDTPFDDVIKKYRKSFLQFWENHIDNRYLLQADLL